MKKYKFKLEKLLKIKEHREKEAKIAYAGELSKKVNMENQNKSLEQDMENAAIDEYDAHHKGDTLDFSTINSQVQFMRGSRKRIANNIQDTEAMQHGLEELRNKLIEAVKEKKKLEKLEEKEYASYRKEKKKEEIKTLDDQHYLR